jgi:hypothetical protein
LAVTVPEIVAPSAFAVCAELRETGSKNPVRINNPHANIVLTIFITPSAHPGPARTLNVKTQRRCR